MASALGTRAPCCCLQPAAARAHALAPGISFAPCSSTPFSAASTRPCSTSGIRPRPHPPRTICAAGAPPPGAQFAPAFGLLSASSALLAVAALVAPEALLKPAFGAGNYSALALPYLSLAGGSLTLSCAVEFCLKVWVFEQRLPPGAGLDADAGAAVVAMAAAAARSIDCLARPPPPHALTGCGRERAPAVRHVPAPHGGLRGQEPGLHRGAAGREWLGGGGRLAVSLDALQPRTHTLPLSLSILRCRPQRPRLAWSRPSTCRLHQPRWPSTWQRWWPHAAEGPSPRA